MEELLVTTEETGAAAVPDTEGPLLPEQETQETPALEESDLTPGEATETDALPPEGEEDASPATPVDYARMAEEDLREIQRIAPSLSHLTHLSQLPNVGRYAALRDAGLTCEEAFWAACHTVTAAAYDNRSHLVSAVPRGAAGAPSVMTSAEMAAAKELFGDLSESEIHRLYQKCRA